MRNTLKVSSMEICYCLPQKKIAVLACMDARLNVNDLLGLGVGEAHIIRNAGGIATEDAIRSLIISHELLGTEEFFVINHTDCGMLTFSDQDLQEKISEKYNSNASGIVFHSFDDLEENVRKQVDKIRNTPFIIDVASVTGFVYDVRTGRIKEIK
ncbi:beta-class carbonic anhydrase [Candidatus Nitrosocosmicus sp. R]